MIMGDEAHKLIHVQKLNCFTSGCNIAFIFKIGDGPTDLLCTRAHDISDILSGEGKVQTVLLGHTKGFSHIDKAVDDLFLSSHLGKVPGSHLAFSEFRGVEHHSMISKARIFHKSIVDGLVIHETNAGMFHRYRSDRIALLTDCPMAQHVAVPSQSDNLFLPLFVGADHFHFAMVNKVNTHDMPPLHKNILPFRIGSHALFYCDFFLPFLAAVLDQTIGLGAGRT